MKYTTVSIPLPLNEKVKKVIKNSGFASTSAFVIFVLRELLSEGKNQSIIANEEKIKEKLKNLGYL
jgi:Arc/MetJ-type ribon-helix-helix transcriptional regulator